MARSELSADWSVPRGWVATTVEESELVWKKSVEIADLNN